MPGVVNANFYGGAQGEYLAQYLLSVIGSAVAVPRQVDNGVDFHCSIATEENGLLFFDFPFLIQIKTVGEKDLTIAELVFGETSDKGKWKDYEIKWLSSQRIPIFIGLISKKSNSLRIYSTSSMWFVFHDNPNPSKIKFSCRLDQSTQNVGYPTNKRLQDWKVDDGDGLEYTVDLGPPVVNVDVKTVWDKNYLEEQKRQLVASIEIEQFNILYRKLQIPYFKWLWNIGEKKAGMSYPVKQNNDHSRHLSNILFATAINFMAQNDDIKLGHLKSLLKTLPRDHFPVKDEETSEDLVEILNTLFETE